MIFPIPEKNEIGDPGALGSGHTIYVWIRCSESIITAPPNFWRENRNFGRGSAPVGERDPVVSHRHLAGMLMSATYRLPKKTYIHDFLHYRGQKCPNHWGIHSAKTKWWIIRHDGARYLESPDHSH